MSLLDDLDGSIESQKKLSTKSCLEKNLEKTVDLQEEILKKDQFNYKEFDLGSIQVTSDLIEAFCRELKQFQNHSEYHRSTTLLNAMIVKAYENGCRDLVLNFGDLEKPLPHIADGIKVPKKLSLIIYDKTGFAFARNSKNLDIIFQGEAGNFSCTRIKDSKVTFNHRPDSNCGTMATNSELIFNDNSGNIACRSALNSKLIFNGLIENGSLGNIDRCDVYINGDMDDYVAYHAKGSKFHAKDINVLRQIASNVKTGCKYYLIGDEDENEVTL